jgi:glycosyltransferase involved in cell wall biosynthesis
VRNLETGIADTGHAVEVVHVDPDDHDRRPGDYLPQPKWCYTARATATGQFVYLNAVARETRAAIERFDPDVVHAMHVREWPALVAARERGIPTALSTYALELEEQTLAANAIDDADTVHAISEFTRSLVEDAARGPVETSVIPASIRVSDYREARTRLDEGGHNGPGPVVTLARFVDRKNVETVTRAWDRLDPGVREGRELVLAGDGPRREALERLAEDVADVRFVGWVNSREKHDLLARADVFCSHAARSSTSRGSVSSTSRLRPREPPSWKHGGAPEAIDDAGVVVEDENDPEEVADAIAALLVDESRREACLGAAADRIDGFDVHAVTGRHVALYRDLL